MTQITMQTTLADAKKILTTAVADLKGRNVRYGGGFHLSEAGRAKYDTAIHSAIKERVVPFLSSELTVHTWELAHKHFWSSDFEDRILHYSPDVKRNKQYTHSHVGQLRDIEWKINLGTEDSLELPQPLTEQSTIQQHLDAMQIKAKVFEVENLIERKATLEKDLEETAKELISDRVLQVELERKYIDDYGKQNDK